MQKTQEKVIDNINYTTTQFSASKGLRTMHKLGKFISGPLSILAGKAGQGKILDRDIPSEKLAEAVQSFFMACDEHTFETTVKDLLTNTVREGKPINFDIDFTGQLGHLMKVLAFVLEVNFKDFFGGLKELPR